MVQWVQVLAMKPDNVIGPRAALKVKGESKSHKVFV